MSRLAVEGVTMHKFLKMIEPYEYWYLIIIAKRFSYLREGPLAVLMPDREITI